jgi:hypothetical protein
MALPQEKSTYNRSRNWTTQLSPFDIVYRTRHRGGPQKILLD